MENLLELFEETKREYPHVLFSDFFHGHVIGEAPNSYQVIINHFKDDNEYMCEIDKEKFPSGDIQEGTIFYLYFGESDADKSFSLIKLSTQVWTQEMIEEMHKIAQDLNSSFLVKKDF